MGRKAVIGMKQAHATEVVAEDEAIVIENVRYEIRPADSVRSSIAYIIANEYVEYEVEETTVYPRDSVDLLINAEGDAVGWICPDCGEPILAAKAGEFDGGDPLSYCCEGALVEW